MRTYKAEMWLYLDDECFSFLRRELGRRKSCPPNSGRPATYGAIIQDLLVPYVYDRMDFDPRLEELVPPASRGMKHRAVGVDPEWKADFLAYLEKRRQGGLWPCRPYAAVSAAIRVAMDNDMPYMLGR